MRRRIHIALPPRGWLFVLPALAMVGLFVYYPVVENVRLSLFRWNAFSTTQRFVGIDNYAALVDDPVFWSALANNIAYAIVSAVRRPMRPPAPATAILISLIVFLPKSIQF